MFAQRPCRRYFFATKHILPLGPLKGPQSYPGPAVDCRGIGCARDPHLSVTHTCRMTWQGSGVRLVKCGPLGRGFGRPRRDFMAMLASGGIGSIATSSGKLLNAACGTVYRGRSARATSTREK